MKSKCFRLVCLVSIGLLVAGIGCQEQTKPPPPVVKPTVGPPTEVNVAEPNGPPPRIMFEKVVYDFGEAGPGTKMTGAFKFTNAGAGVLKITSVEECCGCAHKLDKREFAPGEGGTVEVECRWGQQPLTIRRNVYVNSNDKVTPRVMLTLKGSIVQKVSYEPDRLNLLLKEDANCPAITLIALDGKPFSIKRFNSTDNCITADVDTSVEATKFVLQPKIDVEKLRRGVSGFIEISLSHPESEAITIPFTALPAFELNPPLIIAFNAEPQKPVERDLWVLSNYGADFEIESTSSQNNIIKVLSQQKIHNGYQLKLQITPPAAEANQRIFTDIFTVNIKGGEKLTVTCRGFYQRTQ